jgi:transcriptional regulator with XRE-family HTH domain
LYKEWRFTTLSVDKMDILNDLSKIRIDHSKLKALRGHVNRKIVAEVLGVGTSQVSNIENGIREPTGSGLLRLMLLYGIKAEDIAVVKGDEK